MNKKSRMIEVMNNYLKNVPSSSSWDTYTYGKIPRSLVSNACNSYAGAIQYDDVIGLVDTTAFGNGKTGLLFTEYKVYYNHGFLGARGAISYQSIYDSGKISNSVFDSSLINKQALVEVLSKLADIRGETVQSTVQGINKGIDNLTNTVGSIMDTIDRLGSLWGSIKGAINSKNDDDDE